MEWIPLGACSTLRREVGPALAEAFRDVVVSQDGHLCASVSPDSSFSRCITVSPETVATLSMNMEDAVTAMAGAVTGWADAVTATVMQVCPARADGTAYPAIGI